MTILRYAATKKLLALVLFIGLLSIDMEAQEAKYIQLNASQDARGNLTFEGYECINRNKNDTAFAPLKDIIYGNKNVITSINPLPKKVGSWWQQCLWCRMTTKGPHPLLSHTILERRSDLACNSYLIIAELKFILISMSKKRQYIEV